MPVLGLLCMEPHRQRANAPRDGETGGGHPGFDVEISYLESEQEGFQWVLLGTPQSQSPSHSRFYGLWRSANTKDPGDENDKRFRGTRCRSCPSKRGRGNREWRSAVMGFDRPTELDSDYLECSEFRGRPRRRGLAGAAEANWVRSHARKDRASQ